MSLKPETIQKINAALVNIKEQINLFQSSYLAANGGYWQGIRTPTEPSKEGVGKNIEVSKKPTDQQADWTGVLSTLSQPCTIAVHTHDGPDGMGYTIYVRSIAEDNTKWVKAIGIKAYSQTFDWQKVEETDGLNR